MLLVHLNVLNDHLDDVTSFGLAREQIFQRRNPCEKHVMKICNDMDEDEGYNARTASSLLLIHRRVSHDHPDDVTLLGLAQEHILRV